MGVVSTELWREGGRERGHSNYNKHTPSVKDTHHKLSARPTSHNRTNLYNQRSVFRTTL